jgi:hypothetical protein
MSNQYKAVAAILTSTITTISQLLNSSEDEMHKLRISNRLKQEADQLLLLTGSGDLQTGQPAVLGPATTIGGKPIGKVRKFTEADMIPSDDKVHQLKEAIEDALEYFGPEANAAGILANIPELVIRGVAKKAGLKVTKDEPKELTVEFIEQIKTALADQKEEQQLFKPGGPLTGAEIRELAHNIKEAIEEAKAEKEDSEPKDGAGDIIPPVDETKAPASETVVEATEQPATDQPKPEEPKQEQKAKETDPKKKTGK